jgi:hypothetical protein
MGPPLRISGSRSDIAVVDLGHLWCLMHLSRRVPMGRISIGLSGGVMPGLKPAAG